MALSAIINAMSNTPPPQLRVFAFKDVVRFARKFHIPDDGIWDVVLSKPDADLGGGLYKYRIARPGEGSRGGGRVLIALKIGSRAILMFAWEKKDMENINKAELRAFRMLAKSYATLSERQIGMLLAQKYWIEICKETKS